MIRDLDLVTKDEYLANLSACYRLSSELYMSSVVRYQDSLFSFRADFNRFPAFRSAFASLLRKSFRREYVSPVCKDSFWERSPSQLDLF